MAKASTAPKAHADEAVQSAPSEQNGNRPVHTIRYRGCEAAIWLNAGTNGTAYHSVTVRKSYKDDQGQWHDVQSFLFSDLPHLAKAITDAHSWIAATERDSAPTQGGRR